MPSGRVGLYLKLYSILRHKDLCTGALDCRPVQRTRLNNCRNRQPDWPYCNDLYPLPEGVGECFAADVVRAVHIGIWHQRVCPDLMAAVSTSSLLRKSCHP